MTRNEPEAQTRNLARREDLVRKRGNFPTLGLTPMPSQHVSTILSGNFAWDLDDDTAVPPRQRPTLLGGAPFSRSREVFLPTAHESVIHTGVFDVQSTDGREAIELGARPQFFIRMTLPGVHELHELVV